MYNDIYILAEGGQFDDAEEDNQKDVKCTINYTNNKLVEKIKKLNTDLEINNYEDSDTDFEDYTDDFTIQTGKAELRANNVINYSSWADKMDLMKVKSNLKATDKSDNATHDRVLDKRSESIMHKMIRQKVFTAVKGNISAGKEANIYYATTVNNEDLVVKVYMTAIMPFKREIYVKDDYRYKHAKLSSNTKIIEVWAEKEFRNLMRISETNGFIPCPKPIKQRKMVLVMSMIGRGGEAAPKLKDLQFEDDGQWLELYEQILGYVRILFQECRLVHADLSEYNLLYHDNKVWMIDVSQSVEHCHGEALYFLRRDCHTINTFFRNKGIKTVSLREFYDFVVDPNICHHSDIDFKNRIHKLVEESDYFRNTEEDAFFLNCHIDRKLSDVDTKRMESDYKALRKDPNHVSNCLYASVTGMTEELGNTRNNLKKSIKSHKQKLKMLKNQIIEDQAEDLLNEKEEDEEKNNEHQESQNEECEKSKKSVRPINETKEEKKLRKKEVKENQREKRVENKKKDLEEKARTIRGFKGSKLKTFNKDIQ